MAIFSRFLCPVFLASRVQHISDMHSKCALRPHHGSMVDIQSATAEVRRGKKEERKKKKKPQDENIMSASATQGRHNKFTVAQYATLTSAWSCVCFSGSDTLLMPAIYCLRTVRTVFLPLRFAFLWAPCSGAGHYILQLWFLLLLLLSRFSFFFRSVGKFGAAQQISTGFACWLRYCTDVAHRMPNILCTFGRLLDWYTIYAFSAVLPLDGILPGAKFTLLQVLRSPILAASLHGTPAAGVSQTLRRWEEAPPIFDRAAITLRFGPHSSYGRPMY